MTYLVWCGGVLIVGVKQAGPAALLLNQFRSGNIFVMLLHRWSDFFGYLAFKFWVLLILFDQFVFVGARVHVVLSKNYESKRMLGKRWVKQP